MQPVSGSFPMCGCDGVVRGTTPRCCHRERLLNSLPGLNVMAKISLWSGFTLSLPLLVRVLQRGRSIGCRERIYLKALARPAEGAGKAEVWRAHQQAGDPGNTWYFCLGSKGHPGVEFHLLCETFVCSLKAFDQMSPTPMMKANLLYAKSTDFNVDFP